MITDTTAPRRTRRKLARTLFAGIAAGALASSFATLAMAEDAKINSMSFNTLTPYKKNIIQVTSSDGERWDRIVPGQVQFWAQMDIDTKYPGYVDIAGIFLGMCEGRQCGVNGNPLVFVASPSRRDYHNAKDVTFSTSKLQLSGLLAASTPYGDEILKGCNKKKVSDGAHEFDMNIGLTFTANTRKGNPDDGGSSGEVVDPESFPWGGGDATRHGEFIGHIECLATRKSNTPDREPERVQPVATKDIDLFLTTVIPPSSGPRPSGTQCKPIKVTTRIKTDKAGPVPVKLWRQVNGGPITSEPKQMMAEALGGGQFGDDWVKVEHFTQTTTVQYKAETFGGTFSPSTPWKSITIHCNGDYAPPQTNTDPAVPPRGRPLVELPPTVVTPPLCGTKAAKVRGAKPCTKVAPLPDQRPQVADQKRKEAAEAKRRAAKEAEQRRREAAAKNAELLRRQQMMQQRPVMHRPFGFGRPMGPPPGGIRRGNLHLSIMYGR
jgi:hypothetical protein